MSFQDLKSTHRPAETRTEPHLNLVCPNGVPIDRKLCCWVVFRHFLKPRLLHVGESRCRFIQITWYSCRRGGNKKWGGGDGKELAHRQETTHTDQKTPTSHSSAIRSSLNMQQRQRLNLLPSAMLATETSRSLQPTHSTAGGSSYLVESVV